MGKAFSNLVGLITQLKHNNADGVVLFNRSYSPDINIHDMTFSPGPVFTNPSSFHETLRWIGIVSGTVPNIDIAASTGIHDYEKMIKCILAGASAVQICSLIYKEGPDVIQSMLDALREWMSTQGFKSIDQFKIGRAHV